MLAPIFNLIKRFLLLELLAIGFIIYNLVFKGDVNPGEVSVLLVYENLAYWLAAIGFIVFVQIFMLFKLTSNRKIRLVKPKFEKGELSSVAIGAVVFFLIAYFLIVFLNELTTGFFSAYICPDGLNKCGFEIFHILEKGVIVDPIVKKDLEILTGGELNKSYWIMVACFFLAMTFDFMGYFNHPKARQIATFPPLVIASIRTLVAPIWALIACLIFTISFEINPDSKWTSLLIMLLTFRLGIYISILLINKWVFKWFAKEINQSNQKT